MLRQRAIRHFAFSITRTVSLAVLLGLLIAQTSAAAVIQNEEHLVQHLYTEILNREADPSGLANYSDQLMRGASVADVARSLIACDEYKSKHRSDAQYVTMLYRALWGRDPDLPGFEGWMRQLTDNPNRSAVLDSFASSSELIAVGADTNNTAWQLAHVFNEIRDMAGQDTALFVIAKQNEDDPGYQLYRSLDAGGTWQKISLRVASPKNLHALAVDGQHLYVSGDGGIYRSDNQGNSFAREFHWWWDATVDVDVRNGHGWAAVTLWGSNSGILRKSPGESWKICPGLNTGWHVVADSQDPSTTAYVSNADGHYLSRDGGQSWSGLTRKALFSSLLRGQNTVFAGTSYSTDQGSTWNQLPNSRWDSMLGYGLVDSGNAIIAAGINLVWKGDTNALVPIMGGNGTSQSGLVAQAAGRVFVSRDNGAIYRMQ